MSRSSKIALTCTVLLALALVATSPARAGDQNQNLASTKSIQQDVQQQQQPQQLQQQKRQQDRQQQLQQQQQLDIDLTELTPSLEQQLQQARRLNQRDSSDENILADDAYRYDIIQPQTQESLFAAGSNGGGGDERPIVQTGDWFDRLQLGNNQKRRSANSGGTTFAWWPNSGPNNGRYSRGLPRYYHTKEDEAKYSAMPLLLADQKEDRAHALMSLPASFVTINNRESAARDSLWPSGLLRDLLIAQEAANRVRRLDQITRSALAERRLKAAAKINRASAPDGRPNGLDFLETREKKRRCKVDPNLGVKNPSFCDTDAYFGAADYSMRDVWDSAGRR